MQMLVNYTWLQKTKHQLLDIIKRNAQAIMLYGHQGIGKKSLSLWLAKILLCENTNTAANQDKSCNSCSACHLFDIFQHPDLHILDYKDEKFADTNNIGIDNIHNLISGLQQTPHMGKMQAVIIYTIEQLTIAASNALLKTLEEPNNKTIFIIISHNIKKVMPTILSRCISINIPHPDKHQGIEWINQNSHNIPDTIKNLFAHKPLLSRNYDENIYINTIGFLTNPHINELKIDSKKTQQLSQILNIFSYWLFDLLYYIYRGKTKYFSEINLLKKYAASLSIEKIYICWQYLLEAGQYNNFNLNIKLILSMLTHKYQDIFTIND